MDHNEQFRFLLLLSFSLLTWEHQFRNVFSGFSQYGNEGFTLKENVTLKHPMPCHTEGNPKWEQI